MLEKNKQTKQGLSCLCCALDKFGVSVAPGSSERAGREPSTPSHAMSSQGAVTVYSKKSANVQYSAEAPLPWEDQQN